MKTLLSLSLLPRRRGFLALACAEMMFLTLAAPLHAQAPTKIFVASFGSDANSGSRGSPKRTFQAAHDAVAAGGQIVVLDTAGYGQLTITKSLAVTVPPGVNGFVTVTDSSLDGIAINAGSTDTVSLRGLIVEYSGPQNFSDSNTGGIYTTSVGNLAIEDCTVRNFYNGIVCAAVVSTNLYVHNCTVRGCNTVGLSISANTADAAINVFATVADCRIEANQNDGVFVSSQNGTTDVTLTGCFVSGNLGIGILASGLSAHDVVRVSDCTITSNAYGVVVGNNGQMLSRGNNTLENNYTVQNPNSYNTNTFPATYSAK